MCRGSNTSKLMIGQRVHGGHRKRIRQKGRKAKVVAAGWGTELNAKTTHYSQDDFEDKNEYNKGYLAEWILWNLKKRMNRRTDTRRNGYFGKISDHLFHPIPNHHPTKINVL